MNAAKNYAAEATKNIQHALEQMALGHPVSASGLMAGAPMPETSKDIERYVRGLLTNETPIR